MNETIHFTHLVTGKRVTVFDRRAISAIIHGDCKTDSGIKTNTAFLVIDKVPNPIPVQETEDEIKEKLGLKETQE